VVNAGRDLKPINGWSSNDLMLFAAFFRSYDPVYNLQAYEKLYAQYTHFRPMALRDFIYSFRTGFGLKFTIILLFLLFYISSNQERIKILLQCMLLVALAWFIYASLQMKERALLSMLLAFCIGLLLIHQRSEPLHTKLRIPLILLWAGFMLTATENQSRKIRGAADKTEQERDLSLHLIDKMQRNQATWLVWGPALPLESLSPFKHSFTHQDRNPAIYPVSVFNKSPLLRQHYKRSLEEMLVDPSSRILSMNDAWVTFTPERLDTFYRNHLGCRLLPGGDSLEIFSGRRIFWFKGCPKIQAP
jgi:hypothetical protein